MTAIILEDESIAMRRMQRLIYELFENTIEVVGNFQSIEDLLNYLQVNPQPDIMFLDVMVADGNSFELFEIIPIESKVIFTTAYDEFAVQAFRKNAIDYLLKPIKKELLIEAVRKIVKAPNDNIIKAIKEIEPFKKRFLVRFGNKLHSIVTEDIAYIYSEDKLSFFILKNGQRVSSDLRLQNIQDVLNPKDFFRANRQFVLHIDSISEILRHTRSRLNVRLKPEYKGDIIISTENTPNFKKWMDR